MFFEQFYRNLFKNEKNKRNKPSLINFAVHTF